MFIFDTVNLENYENKKCTDTLKRGEKLENKDSKEVVDCIKSFLKYDYIYNFCSEIQNYFIDFSFLLFMCGDVELNPGASPGL